MSFLKELWSSPVSADTTEAREIRRQQDLYRAKRTPVIVVAGLVNAGITAAVFWDSGPRMYLAGWLFVLLLATAIRLHQRRAEKRRGAAGGDATLAAAGWSIFMGLLWGTTAVVLLQSHGAIDANGHTLHVFLAFVIGGMGASAVASLSYLPLACIGFILPSLLPLIVSFALEGSPLSWVMTAMLSLYLAALMVFTRNGYGEFLDMVRARLERQDLLDQVSEARDQLTEALETMSEGFVLFDAEDRLVLCNDRFRAFYASPDDPDAFLPGTRFKDLARRAAEQGRQVGAIGRVSEWLADRMASHRNPGPPIEQEMSADRWIRVEEHKTRNGGTVGIHVDITELKHRELELAEKSSLLEATLESIDQGVAVVDENLLMVAWNQRFIDMFGFPDELCEAGAPIQTLLQYNLERGEYEEQDIEEVMEKRVQLVRGGRPVREERRRPDGRIFEITRNPMPDGGMVNTFTDITERRRAEEMLRQALIFENISEAVILMDLEGRILDWNPAARAIFGFEKSEVIGKTASAYCCPNDTELFAERIAAAARLNKRWTGERQFVRKDGSTGVSETVILPLQGEDGQPVGIIEVNHDITDRKQAEAEQARLAEQFHQAQKMEAVGTLAGGIAHDFNNILGIIIGYAEFGLESAPGDGTVDTSLAHILSAGLRARSLVEQILTFTRQGERELAPVRMDRVVPAAVNLLRATLPTTIEFSCTVECGEVTALADATQIDQVIMNLCVNAGHAIGEATGAIAVTLERVESLPESAEEPGGELRQETDGGPPIRFDRTADGRDRMQVGVRPAAGSYLRLSVADTGCGMDRDVMSRIFDPFYTTKDVGKGTGLGLASVHGIVSSHGGVIVVDSAPGQGATFEIYLPEIDGVSETRNDAPAVNVTGDERILFVDDEEDIVAVASLALARLGYRVEGVCDSRVAFDLFRASPDRWDLVITDQTMPHITGSALAAKIAAIRGDIPIILCSGYRGVDAEPEPAGVSAFLMKPVRWTTLATEMRRLLDAGGDCAGGDETGGNDAAPRKSSFA